MVLLLGNTVTVQGQSRWGRVLSSAVKTYQASTITDEELAEYVSKGVKEMDCKNTVYGSGTTYGKTISYKKARVSPGESYEMSCAILLMQSGLVPKVERGDSPDAIWWYLNASGLPLRTRFCTSPDAIKIIPDAFRYQLKRAKI